MTDNQRLVLMVDDDPLFVGQVGQLLNSAGYSLLQASNGIDGLRQLDSGSPGLVILDVNMPELDGLQTCRMIRAQEKHRDLPILMLTARGDITHRLEAQKMGATDYLVKPVDAESLLQKVKRLFAQ
jgi:DNA-binding response OmpR family regulator